MQFVSASMLLDCALQTSQMSHLNPKFIHFFTGIACYMIENYSEARHSRATKDPAEEAASSTTRTLVENWEQEHQIRACR